MTSGKCARCLRDFSFAGKGKRKYCQTCSPPRHVMFSGPIPVNINSSEEMGEEGDKGATEFDLTAPFRVVIKGHGISIVLEGNQQ